MIRYVVSIHFHSVKILLFSSARSRDFDGMYSTRLPVLMYTTKTSIDMCRFTEDNRCQIVAIPHMTITTFIRVVYLICVTKLDDSLFWGGGRCVKLYASVEKLGLISNSIYSVVNLGVCSLNLYTVVHM